MPKTTAAPAAPPGVRMTYAELGVLLVLACDHTLPRFTWGYDRLCRVVARVGAKLPRVERGLVRDRLLAHPPPVNTNGRWNGNPLGGSGRANGHGKDGRRVRWEAAVKAVGGAVA